MAGSGLDRATLAKLDESIEVDMATTRRDGSQSRRPIWVVVVDGNAYVRSYHGESDAWYRRARADGQARIGVHGRAIEVGVEPVSDEETNRKVSAAFCAKYSERSPGPTETMVNDEPNDPATDLGQLIPAVKPLIGSRLGSNSRATYRLGERSFEPVVRERLVVERRHLHPPR
jgi:hypothetical protein